MAIKADVSFSLKDELFNASTVTELAVALAQAKKGFNKKRYITTALEGSSELELKQRIDHLVQVTAEHLPSDFNDALTILKSALPPPLDPSKTDDDFG